MSGSFLSLKTNLLNRAQSCCTFAPAKIFYYIMKSLLKFSLLTALIISGKLAKQPAPAAVAQTVKTQLAPDSSMILVHQVYSAEPAQLGREKAQPQHGGSGFLAKMF
jgi:hypothetical protein